MKRTIIIMALAALAIQACSQKPADCDENGRWTVEKACAWGEQTGWKSGCNFTPSTAINQIEMWQSSSFDEETIDRELGWAEELGFTTARVYLSSVVWNNEADAFKAHMDRFLEISDAHGIKPVLVFFDDCWDAESAYGPQREPKPGVHNSGWVKDPSIALRADTTALYANLEAYVKDILTAFKDDERVLMWDLFNEPREDTAGGISLSLLANVYRWAREIRPSQPLTSAAFKWTEDYETVNRMHVEMADVLSYHCYAKPETQMKLIEEYKAYGRPVYCSEYMARTRGCTFENTLPLLHDNGICAINWGFVAGKTNTIYAWDTPIEDGSEPEVWFHDVMRKDKTPFDEDEITLIKSINGVI